MSMHFPTGNVTRYGVTEISGFTTSPNQSVMSVSVMTGGNCGHLWNGKLIRMAVCWTLRNTAPANHVN